MSFWMLYQVNRVWVATVRHSATACGILPRGEKMDWSPAEIARITNGPPGGPCP